jgi:hypothetical protein
MRMSLEQKELRKEARYHGDRTRYGIEVTLDCQREADDWKRFRETILRGLNSGRKTLPEVQDPLAFCEERIRYFEGIADQMEADVAKRARRAFSNAFASIDVQAANNPGWCGFCRGKCRLPRNPDAHYISPASDGY